MKTSKHGRLEAHRALKSHNYVTVRLVYADEKIGLFTTIDLEFADRLVDSWNAHDALIAALADACTLLDGWIATKCPARYKAEHFADVDKKRALIARGRGSWGYPHGQQRQELS